MKILKQFEDPEYFDGHYPDEVGQWFWGLSTEGDLYWRCTDAYYDANEWHECDRSLEWIIDIPTMKKIVKEFGHLLVFL